MSISLVLIPIAVAIGGQISTATTNKLSTGSFCLQTKIKDKTLLEEALRSYQCRSFSTDNCVNIDLEGAEIQLIPNEQGIFEATFNGDIPVEGAQRFIDELHHEYFLRVQEHVYKKLLLRAREQKLTLESEEIKEDNSVVLTFTI